MKVFVVVTDEGPSEGYGNPCAAYSTRDGAERAIATHLATEEGGLIKPKWVIYPVDVDKDLRWFAAPPDEVE